MAEGVRRRENVETTPPKRELGAGQSETPCPRCGAPLHRAHFYDEEAVEGWKCDECGFAALGSDAPTLEDEI